MKIAAISYPMLFQRIGGLQIQILESTKAVCRAGHEMRIIDPSQQLLSQFDIVHVFSYMHGTHKIVEQARNMSVPVVVSPLARSHWTRSLGRYGRWVERLVGRLTNWEITTNYNQMLKCINSADHLISLGALETKALTEGFDIKYENITEIPNGISPRFFSATEDLACSRWGIDPGYILCVGSIEERKNQLGLAKALRGLNKQLVLVGQCQTLSLPYLKKVLEQPCVRYLGALKHEDPLLASLYAGAGVFALPSFDEVMPLALLEALASGAPVVITNQHGMTINGMEKVLREVEPTDTSSIFKLVQEFLNNRPSAAQCRAAVEHLTWDEVASQLIEVYERTIASYGNPVIGNPPNFHGAWK